MINEINGRWVTKGIWFWKSHVSFASTGKELAVGLEPDADEKVAAEQKSTPTKVMHGEVRGSLVGYWWYQDRYWLERENLTSKDVKALVHQKDLAQKRQLERAHAVLAAKDLPTARERQVIPTEVKREVFERDEGACVHCGSQFDNQYDHIIPFSFGGSSTAQNLQLLCGPCNREKGASLA